ncbi:MAG: helix-turn-helix transcriptional regulator [Fimbriimonadaceae bacterium]
MRKKPGSSTLKQADQILSVLSAARQKAGLSQRQLSAELGLHYATVSKIERGERQLTVTEFLLVCSILGVSPIAILRSALND